MLSCAQNQRNKLDTQKRIKGIQYPAFNAALNPLYCTIDGKTYKVCQDLNTGVFTVKTVTGEEVKTEFDNTLFSKFVMHGDALIKSKLVDQVSGDVSEKTLQFMDVKNGNKYSFYYKGSYVNVDVFEQEQFELKKYMAEIKPRDTAKLILSPMPGGIVSVSVVPGQVVVDGQELCVIEAMKMQNLIRSEKEAKIKSVKVKKGQSVAVDEVLIEFE